MHLPQTGASAVLAVRPTVSDLVFQLYARSLHPELFLIHASRTVERGDYQATMQITSTGHLVSWRYRGRLLTEVASSAHQLLPQKKKLMTHRLRVPRDDQVQVRGGVRYQVSLQVETVEPEVFSFVQSQLVTDSSRRGLLYVFSPSCRIAPGALSYLNVETRRQSMLVQAFHTFPNENAIVKSQSLFELPRL